MKNLTAVMFSFLALSFTSLAAQPRLPEGNSGIAHRYPGDINIEKDRDVILTEKFDASPLSEITKSWDDVKNHAIMSLSDDTPPASADNKSLLITHIGGQSTGAHLYRRLGKDYDKVFARFYVKFAPDCAPVHHFGTNLGGNNPASPWPAVSAGNRPPGNKQFWTGVEPFGNKWNWDFYTYWQGMHIHGDGNYWGTPFLVGAVPPPVKKGEWICVEMMVKINDPPDKSNGVQAFWIDGKLVRRDNQIVSHIGPGFPKGKWTGGWFRPDAKSDSAFEGFAWRSVPDYAVNYVWAYLYTTKAPPGHKSKVWFDNIIVAKSYIGPIQPTKK